MKNKVSNRNIIFTVAVVLVFQIFLLTKFLFTAWPEMLAWPYLWINGILPYKDVAIVHTPILVTKLVLFYKIFGVGIYQLKIFTWLVIIISDVLVFLVGRKLWNVKVALVSLIVYTFIIIFYNGNGLWFDLLLMPVGLIVFCFVKSKNFFLAGLFWTLAFLTKQTAIFFLVPIVYELYVLKNKKTEVNKFFIGGFVVFFAFLISLLIIGVLPSFIYWAINFGTIILPHAQGQIQFPDTKTLIVAAFPFVILAPLIFTKNKKDKGLIYWAVAGSLGAYPRFEYFHFLPALPYLAFAVALILPELRKKLLYKIFLVFYCLGILYLFFSYTVRNWGEGTRFYEQDVQDVVSFIHQNTNPGDRIFVMNWWDNIYALTGTLPATDPLVPQLAWYQELPGVQEKEVDDLIKTKPKMILLQPYSETGLSSFVPQKVYTYVITNYKVKNRVDVIEILVPKE